MVAAREIFVRFQGTQMCVVGKRLLIQVSPSGPENEMTPDRRKEQGEVGAR